MTGEEQFELERIEKQFSKCIHPIVSEGIISEEVMLRMDDGVSLKTILFYPEKREDAPTIMVRTCYPKNDYIYRATAREYAKRGFAYIYQYCRGTGESEGEWEPNVNERADGKKTIEWVCGLPWVGSVGYCGCSYLALTGWLIADILPDKVKTMYLTHYGAFRFVSAYQDGMFRHDVLTAWAMENAGFPIEADYLESCRFQPHMEVDEKLWGKKIDWYREWISSTNESDSYWNSGFWKLLKEIPGRVRVPIYLGEGWYDHHLASAVETWRALSEECRGKSKFLIGAWDHNFNVILEGHNGQYYEKDDILRAFDWFWELLVEKEEPRGEIDTYIIGDDTWHVREKYEIEKQKEVSWYPGEGGRLLAAPGVTGYRDFCYDPEQPVWTHGAESLLVTDEEKGSLLQPKPNYRKDAISFVSEPLAENIAVLGKIKVNLEVESEAEDTAFAVKVMEVMANGEAYNMRTGITTLGYRGHSKTRQTYMPGSVVPVIIDMWDLAWKLKKGSRIRIDITSSDFPQYSVHSNFPGVWAEAVQNKKAVQKIHFGKGRKTEVVFPVIEL